MGYLGREKQKGNNERSYNPLGRVRAVRPAGLFYLFARWILSALPGVSLPEGNMRGPSSQDCDKSFARTGVVTAGMLARSTAPAAVSAGLVQIQGLR